MLMKTTLLRYAMLALPAVAMTAAPAQAQQTWDMPNAFSARALDTEFARLEQQNTNGQIKIVNHFDGALGYRGVDHLDAVRDGAVPIARHDLTPYGGYDRVFLISTLPFQVQTPEDLATLQGVVAGKFSEVFEEHNQVLISFGVFPPSGIWSNKDINLETLRDLKIRTADRNGLTTFINAGAPAVNMGWADVIPALGTGAIDAVLTSADTGLSSSIYDHLKIFTEINWALPMTAITVNKDVWDELPEELQAAVREAGEEITQRTLDELRTRVDANYAALEGHGVKIVRDPDPAVIEALKAGAVDVISAWRDEAGDSAALLDEYLSKRNQ
jgi:TRAP-type C4-dicarboxylate transport system substrate-binding protein